jgi:Transglycosylase-like domain
MDCRAGARGRVPDDRNGGIGGLLAILAAAISLALGLPHRAGVDPHGRHTARLHPQLVDARTRLGVPDVVRARVALHRAGHRWRAPRWWLPQAVCIHEHEGAWDDDTGNGYYGGMQFLLSTWQSVGGRGRPDQASPREQLHRAWLVYLRDGHSWREWGTAGACGLR